LLHSLGLTSGYFTAKVITLNDSKRIADAVNYENKKHGIKLKAIEKTFAAKRLHEDDYQPAMF